MLLAPIEEKMWQASPSPKKTKCPMVISMINISLVSKESSQK